MAKLTSTPGKSSELVDEAQLEIANKILRALSHPLRLKILEFIDKNKATNVNKIYNTLKLEQSITSQHLRILRDADLVSTERQGKMILYEVNYTHIDKINKSIELFLTK